jgi:ubiquinone/menaquinone biosynthesis C-methylase UbiE
MSDSHKEYFATAYRTGSDIWSHVPYQRAALQMLPELSRDALVLDVGSGRGLWVLKLVKLGYRVLGIDYEEGIVKRANQTIKEEKIQKKARFVVGDVRDINFTDNGFDMVTDIGLLQHLKKEDWKTYVDEIYRVLKSGGYFLNISLSRRTTRFLDWQPEHAEDGYFEKFGLGYYFFTEAELDNIFSHHFVQVKQQIRFFDTRSDPEDGVALIFTLLKKK